MIFWKKYANKFRRYFQQPKQFNFNILDTICFQILDDDGSVIERTLIYDWEVEHNLTASALALRPRDLSNEPNSIPTLPWLNVTRTTCNCNLFPRSGKVLISTNDAHEIVNQNDNDDNEDDSDEHDGQVVDISITPAPTTSSQPAGTARSTPEYAEKFKLKGSSYHTDFQTALRKCQTLLRAKTAVVCQLNIEPVNIKDENAVVVQSWLDDQWCSLGYVPGKKCHKVLSAIQESQITEIKLTRVYREISVNEGVYYLYGDVVLLKQGRWLPDTKGYKYNDPASKKYFS